MEVSYVVSVVGMEQRLEDLRTGAFWCHGPVSELQQGGGLEVRGCGHLRALQATARRWLECAGAEGM